MMKITKYIFLFIALFISNEFYAQNANQAKACLDKATAAIISHKGGVQVCFSISKLGLGGTSGTVAIKGNKFMAVTRQASVWFDGKTQWTYMKSTNEVNISTPTEAQRLSVNPYSIISMYKNGYTLSMTTKRGQKVVHMVAKNQKRSVPEAYITLSGNQLKQIKMRQGSKWTTIKITSIVPKNLSNSMFQFDRKQYPKAEIIDLR